MWYDQSDGCSESKDTDWRHLHYWLTTLICDIPSTIPMVIFSISNIENSRITTRVSQFGLRNLVWFHFENRILVPSNRHSQGWTYGSSDCCFAWGTSADSSEWNYHDVSGHYCHHKPKSYGEGCFGSDTYCHRVTGLGRCSTSDNPDEVLNGAFSIAINRIQICDQKLDRNLRNKG
jgi:hypothetical protein